MRWVFDAVGRYGDIGKGDGSDGGGWEGWQDEYGRMMMGMRIMVIIMGDARASGPVPVVGALGSTMAVGAGHFGLEADEAMCALVGGLGLL